MTSESGLLTTRTERVVKELWNEVLRAPGVSSTNDNFFELGEMPKFSHRFAPEAVDRAGAVRRSNELNHLRFNFATQPG